MEIEVIPQLDLGSLRRLRVGDVLNRAIADPAYRRFRFAVAYMRVSGWDRLAGSVESLCNRSGRVSGAVGVDQGITSIEALEALRSISSDSTIFYTVSGFIYHPKLYLLSGDGEAIAVVGSTNLTRDGLFRNIELATTVRLRFDSSADLAVYRRYDLFLEELLNTSNPNVQPITPATLGALASARIVEPEARLTEPGTAPLTRARRTMPGTTTIARLFPPMRVPVAPPLARIASLPLRLPAIPPVVVVPPRTVGTVGTFIMQLSDFDSSHRTGIPGTPEVLIPHPAIAFFPRLSTTSGRKYPDTNFDVVLNTPTGQERHGYRLWYYEQRAVGTRIDEYRLRMNHATIDLTTPGGGDLLIISKLPPRSDPEYEVTILPRTDPTFPAFLAKCTYEAQGKRWGVS